MKILIVCLMSGLVSVLSGAAPLPQVIVQSPEAEKAAIELKLYLDKITGENFTVVAEKDLPSNSNAIYLGNTEFARRQGIDFNKFDSEEWLIRTEGASLIIGGGKLHGNIYGVYDFLENQLGCHWFSAESEYIPGIRNIEINNLNIRKQPDFIAREIYLPDWEQGDPQKTRTFLLRNRSNIFDSPWSESHFLIGHSFYHYLSPEKYFKTHPEYFSMNEQGNRFHGSIVHGGGQLCLSNRAVWDIVANTLLENIRKERIQKPQEKWPVLYNVEQGDDTSYFCKCPECKKITDREGSDSGLVIPFINYVAKKVAEKYPDVLIRTMAYVSSEEPPKTSMQIEPNVIIRWCDLYSKSDCYRPLSHPVNAERKSLLDAWAKMGAQISLWDYWNMEITGPYFDPPRIETMVDAIAPDLRYFKKIGIKLYFTEAETFTHRNPQNFIDLQVWLGQQLLLDVNQNENTLIATFMDKHYGPAAKPMTEFLNYLRNSVKNEKKPLFYIYNACRDYTTPEFMKKCYTWLKEARELTAPGTPYRYRVDKELITPLAVMLGNPKLQLGTKRSELLEEYKNLRTEQIEVNTISEKQIVFKNDLARDMNKLTLKIPTPEQFKNLPSDQIKKFGYPNFSNFVDDPDSVTGKAMVTSPEAKHDMRKPGAGGLYPSWFGLYDQDTKKATMLKLNDIPADEKYHWYKVGNFDFERNSFLWGYFWLNNVNLRSVWTNADGLENFNTWEVWISAKITGPAYVKDSQKPNCIYLDQVILVKKDARKAFESVIPFVSSEKISPDLNNLASVWTLTSGRILEENGDKYLKLQKPHQSNIASMSYPEISLQGVKRVKISLKYRSDVYTEALHGGSWFLAGFQLDDGNIKYDGIVLPLTAEWKNISKIFDVPVNAKKMILALRLQDSNVNNFLDAKDIAIEIEK